MKLKMTVVAVILAVFAVACSEGNYDQAVQDDSKTNFDFKNPGSESPGNLGFSGTLGSNGKDDEGNKDQEAKLKKCAEDVNAGLPMTDDCQAIFQEVGASAAAAISETSNSMAAAANSVAAAISSMNSAMSSAAGAMQQMFSGMGNPFGGSKTPDKAGEVIDKLPDQCVQDGDVGQVFIDKDLREAVLKSLKKDPNKGITVQEALGLKVLNASDMGIVNLAGLHCFPNLKTLNLSRNRIVSIDELGQLSQLEGLALNANHISDLSPLKTLKSLKNILLESNYITDITPLIDNPNIVKQKEFGFNINLRCNNVDASQVGKLLGKGINVIVGSSAKVCGKSQVGSVIVRLHTDLPPNPPNGQYNNKVSFVFSDKPGSFDDYENSFHYVASGTMMNNYGEYPFGEFNQLGNDDLDKFRYVRLEVSGTSPLHVKGIQIDIHLANGIVVHSYFNPCLDLILDPVKALPAPFSAVKFGPKDTAVCMVSVGNSESGGAHTLKVSLPRSSDPIGNLYSMNATVKNDTIDYAYILKESKKVPFQGYFVFDQYPFSKKPKTKISGPSIDTPNWLGFDLTAEPKSGVVKGGLIGWLYSPGSVDFLDNNTCAQQNMAYDLQSCNSFTWVGAKFDQNSNKPVCPGHPLFDPYNLLYESDGADCTALKGIFLGNTKY
ncbi:MAG: hypothetical protein COV45_00285 [Deltaproteobacteria bacterium CG11_big_fil_rev_8_21_14_0_20_47_16]|nr:MAG: hypothetical protein COV45_00285 [Deltaproteobacteria bacterium CG11_big_fil_rev_8_21_14_0_20_47_16]